MQPLSLHFLHEQAGARFQELHGRQLVADYGDVGTEYRAARDAVALHDASYREALRITGEDRTTFLHGMVTQDVKGLAPGASAYTALITVKGAMVADGRILRRDDALWLDVEPGLGAKVLEFLGKFLISEDAELSDATGQFGVLRLLGPRTPELLTSVLGVPFEPLAQDATRAVLVAHQDVLLLGAARLHPQGVDLWVPATGLEAVWNALIAAGDGLGLRPLGWRALEVLRVEAGVPRYGQDLVDTTIPLEANLTHGISYNKGCYIGQEVIARATFRGHMNRKLVGLRLGAAEPAPGTELKKDGKKVGWVTTLVCSPTTGEHLALGYVHRDHLEPGTALSVGEGTAEATVAALPFT